MIGATVRVGAAKWLDGLKTLAMKPLRKGREEPVEAPVKPSREPKTEGERALYQAMGWKPNAWE